MKKLLALMAALSLVIFTGCSGKTDKTKTADPKTKTADPKTKTADDKTKTPDPKTKTPDEPKTKTPEPKTKTPDEKTKTGANGSLSRAKETSPDGSAPG